LVEVPTSFAAAWQTYRERRNAFVAAILAFAALLGLVGIVPNTSLVAAYWWVLAPFSFAWLMIAGFRLTYWRCPRCSKPFFTRLFWGNLFARRCLQCGLPKWGDLESVARGA
jgi:hypothetical protein